MPLYYAYAAAAAATADAAIFFAFRLIILPLSLWHDTLMLFSPLDANTRAMYTTNHNSNSTTTRSYTVSFAFGIVPQMATMVSSCITSHNIYAPHFFFFFFFHYVTLAATIYAASC